MDMRGVGGPSVPQNLPRIGQQPETPMGFPHVVAGRAPQQPLPQDQVQLGQASKPHSTLLDKAKTAGLVASVGITAVGLAEAAGIAGLTAALAVPVGIAAVLATGLAAAHGVKHLWDKAHAAPAAPPQPNPMMGVPPGVGSGPAPNTIPLQGTGFAAANVAGIAAAMMQANPGLTSEQVGKILQETAYPNGAVNASAAIARAAELHGPQPAAATDGWHVVGQPPLTPS